MPDNFTVIKRDAAGNTKLEYSGELIAQNTTWVCVRAYFNFEKADVGFAVFERGDLFTEWFYTDRWYNIFQVNSHRDGQLKGWYCNITRPATITATSAAADDLALDVFVTPLGAVHLLDEDEFAELDLAADEQQAALHATETIRLAVKNREAPFDSIPQV